MDECGQETSKKIDCELGCLDQFNCAPLPNGVLIYYGHGGIGPSGIYGYCASNTLAQYYQDKGLQVSYTGQWPASLENYRLVILARPSEPFDSTMTNALFTWMEAGGILFATNEKSFYAATSNLNALMESLSSDLRTESATIGSGGYYGVLTNEIGSHELLDGITTLGFGESSIVTTNSEPTTRWLVKYESITVMMAEPRGLGFIILSGDTNFLDDHALESYPPDGGQNYTLADNLARITS
jgi:hypothetical protein